MTEASSLPPARPARRRKGLAMTARDILLIVDDSPEALGFLTDALEQSGYSVLIATSGQAALNVVDRITPTWC